MTNKSDHLPKSELISWTHLSTRQVFEHPYMNLYEDSFKLPDGQQINWIRFEHDRDSVVVICENADGKVLIARQFCPPTRQIVLEFPGGGISPGEGPTETARREILEEVGVIAQNFQTLGTFLCNVRRSTELCYVIKATDLVQGESRPDPEELIESFWLLPEELDQIIKESKSNNQSLLASWSIYKLSS